ncbi:hypothetical protein PENTCL1PPCAC_16892, partial [Pristionchus entomophagus]
MLLARLPRWLVCQVDSCPSSVCLNPFHTAPALFTRTSRRDSTGKNRSAHFLTPSKLPRHIEGRLDERRRNRLGPSQLSLSLHVPRCDTACT